MVSPFEQTLTIEGLFLHSQKKVSPPPALKLPPPCIEPVNSQFKFEGVMKIGSFFSKTEGQFNLDGQGQGQQF